MKRGLLFIFSVLVVIVQPSTYIISQQFFTEAFSDNDCSVWNPTGASLPTMKFSSCSSHRLFGGYSVFSGDPTTPASIYRTFTNLIPHYSVTVTANFYKIDSWVNNTIFFMVDGVTAKLYTFNAANGGSTDFCGNPTPVTDTINTSFNDLIVPVSFTVSHSASTLTIKIISNLIGTSGSWGIRDFNITMEACDQSCLTCSSGSSCTSCDAAQGLTLSGSFCVCSNSTKIRQKYIPCTAIPCAVCLNSLPCSNGYYLSATTTYCEPCNVACGTCTTPLNSGVTCPTCNAAGFIRPSPGAACASCFSGCQTCASTAANTCTACKYGYFLDSGNSTCVITCPAGTYGEQTSKACLPCSSPCSSCIGFNGASYYCTSCISTRFLYSYSCYITCPYSLLGYQGNCVASCPSGTYADGGTLTCLSCILNCAQCTNGTGCFICNTGTYLNNGICYTLCPATLYGDNQTQLCLSCHSSCLTCNGPFSDNCLSCNASAVALISNICYTVCPNNTYSGLCLPCNSSCLTCSGSTAYNCLSCASPLFFHLNLSACLTSCNVGELSNNYNFTCTQCSFGYVAYFQVCQACSPTCLTCNGISFLDCTSCSAGTSLASKTCVLVNEASIIYMPNKSKETNILDTFMVFFFLNISFCVLLEVLFQYKTNLLLMIELLQILSYTQFLTIQLSQSTQKFARFLYISNFAAFINPITVSAHPSTPPKFQLIGKTGVFLADSFGIQVILVVCCILFLATKYLSQRNDFFKKVYKKINPYLITYTFRLVLLELSLDMMLYLYCFDATSGLGIGSLILLVIDLLCVMASLCWRIKTEQDGTQMALFYYNQIGEKAADEKYLPQEENLGTSIQQKIRKSKILPSLMELLLKVPVPITILYFIGNTSTQTICYFIYFSFYLLLATIVPVRRKVYRLILIGNASFLVLNALGAILVSKGVSSTYFESVWLTFIVILFVLTLLQTISNYQYFASCLSYLRYIIKHGFKNEAAQPNHDSQANLTEQDDQSVVFERVQPQGSKKYGASQSKILSNNHLNDSWMEEKY